MTIMTIILRVHKCLLRLSLCLHVHSKFIVTEYHYVELSQYLT